MRTYVDVSLKDVLRYAEARCERYFPSCCGVAFGAAFLKRFGERLFYERAGWCARPVDFDGIVWLRLEHCDGFRAHCDVPSPEGLLL